MFGSHQELTLNDLLIDLTNKKLMHRYAINKRLDICQDHFGMQEHLLGH